VFLVSKVLPSHANRRGTISACERSLKRLATDRLDLYLLHWPGSVPLRETVDAFEALRHRGLIRHWGVSNFDVSDMEQPGAASVTTNQVLYNLNYRGIEYDLLPWCSTRRVPIMAYSPIDEGRLISHPVLESLASEHAATPAQVALAWVLRQPNVIAIPKSGDADHVVDNRAALDLHLTQDDLARLDVAFPPPTRRIPLEML
jgi:diketogulonate reductase-like aldo/keto reductase